MNINYLVIEGNIGSGKTTLAKMLAKDFQAKSVLEGFEENPFLPKFYKNKDKYAFQLEMSFLADRYSQLAHNIPDIGVFNTITISDYFFMKSLIFAQNTLSEDEYQLYQRFFTIVYEKIPKPDLYVYLHQSTDKLLKNIKKRGRAYEQGIDSLYLDKIYEAYSRFFNQQNDFPILIIDIREIDFVSNKNQYEKMKKLISEGDYKLGVNRVFVE